MALSVITLCSFQQLCPFLIGLLPNSIHAPPFVASFTSQTAAPPRRRPKGVFVFKAMQAQHATQALCHLTHFFNARQKYPVQIFADYNFSNEARTALEEAAGGADAQVIVGTEAWHQFPLTLNVTQVAHIVKTCQHLEDPQQATCAKLNVGLGYVDVGYWRCMKMAYESSLQQLDYFVSLDADAYLTKIMPDPFQIMASNNLTGMFNIEAYQSGSIRAGVQEAAEQAFSLQQRRNRFVNSPQYSYFDSNGKWNRKGQAGSPSIWGCFYGGRLDFFRTEHFKSFAEEVAPHTCTFQADEQPVIGVAWSLLADSEKVWYLPKCGIEMGTHHHGWIDNSEVVRLPPENQTESQTSHWFHTLDQWGAFGAESYGMLLHLDEHIGSLGYEEDNDWRKCLKLCNKNCQ